MPGQRPGPTDRSPATREGRPAIRILLTALNCPKGEMERNVDRHHAVLAQGKQSGCDLVLLPEMSLTGYHAPAAVPLSHPSVLALVEATADAPALCFGLVERPADGGLPYVTQVVASQGRLVAVHQKAGLGAGEPEVFRPGRPADPFELSGVACSFAVCAEIGTDAPYQIESAVVLGPSAPGLYGDRRTSQEDWRRGFDWWRESVAEDARRRLGTGRWLAVSTQAGATVDEDFPGWAALIGPGGEVVAELPDWLEDSLVVDLPGG